MSASILCEYTWPTWFAVYTHTQTPLILQCRATRIHMQPPFAITITIAIQNRRIQTNSRCMCSHEIDLDGEKELMLALTQITGKRVHECVREREREIERTHLHIETQTPLRRKYWRQISLDSIAILSYKIQINNSINYIFNIAWHVNTNRKHIQADRRIY